MKNPTDVEKVHFYVSSASPVDARMLTYLFVSTAATCAGMQQQPSIGIGENAVQESCSVSLRSQDVFMNAAVDNAARNLCRDL